ncbi:hypothetical protein, partial [Neisseria meningitidis]|uniref:hypothetical protein n=1 Tax=Neisseria meningitidis TaxID=487 RepID=UPI001C8F97CE
SHATARNDGDRCPTVIQTAFCMAGLETVSDGIFIGLNLNQDKATKPQTVQAGDEAADSTNRATPVLVFVNPL